MSDSLFAQGLHTAAEEAEMQYNAATDSTRASAGFNLIDKVKAQAHGLEPGAGSNVVNAQWTHDEVDAANQILRKKGLPSISRADTAFWYLQELTRRRITFFATPACLWVPAMLEAASVRIQKMEEELGTAAREIFAPPFVVLVILNNFMMFFVPECVVDLQPNPGELQATNTPGVKGLVALPPARFGYSGGSGGLRRSLVLSGGE